MTRDATARDATALDLSEDQMTRRLDEAREDEQAGQLVRCQDEAELQELFRTLRQ